MVITLFEMINEPRLKTVPYVTCFLFFLSSKATSNKVRYKMVILQSINAGFRTVILVFTWFILYYASYEVKSCLLLNDFMFSCCFHEFSNIFLLSRVDVMDINRGRGEGGVQISNVESTLSVAQ